MLRKLAAFLAILAIVAGASATGRGKSKLSAKADHGNSHSEVTTPVPIPVQPVTPALNTLEAKEVRGSKHEPFWVSSDRSVSDWIAYVGNLALVVVGIGGIVVAGLTLKKIERQTAATEQQARHMVDSERPFIMVETRGTSGGEFWIRNCGKSPAQILFLDPLLTPHFPEWDQSRQQFALPAMPAYGPNYYDDRWEQINVQWLAPGDERCFASFDPSILSALPDDVKAELNQGLRSVRLYSSIKYRGMFSADVYHSRFCYGWGPTGTFMTGPHRYNEYT